MVTWHQLAVIAGIGLSLLLLAGGALAVFAGGMSDNPSAAQETSDRGFVWAIVGAVVLAISIAGIWL